MLTLAEAAKQTQNPLEKGVIELYRNYSPVLNYIAFQGIAGDSKSWNIEKTLPGVGFRAVNEDYTDSEGSVEPRVAKLKIMGGRAKVDRFIEATQGNGTSMLQQQITQKAKAASLFYTKEFFKGSEAVNVDGFDGLDVLIADGLGTELDMGATSVTSSKLVHTQATRGLPV